MNAPVHQPSAAELLATARAQLADLQARRAALAKIDVEALAARARRRFYGLLLVLLAIWIPVSLFLGWAAFRLARHGGFPVGKLALAMFGAVVVNTMIAVAVSFWTSAWLTGLRSRAMLWGQAACWFVALGGATLLLADRAAAMGWHGIGWIRAFGGTAALIGVPTGVSVVLGGLARIAANRERVAEVRAEHDQWQAGYDVQQQWRDEVSLTHAAIWKWSGNFAASSFAIDASQRLTRLLASDEMAEGKPDRIERLRAFRAKVDAGVMPI